MSVLCKHQQIAGKAAVTVCQQFGDYKWDSECDENLSSILIALLLTMTVAHHPSGGAAAKGDFTGVSAT